MPNVVHSVGLHQVGGQPRMPSEYLEDFRCGPLHPPMGGSHPGASPRKEVRGEEVGQLVRRDFCRNTEEIVGTPRRERVR